MAAVAREELRAIRRDLACVLQESLGETDCLLRSCRPRGPLFRLGGRHEKVAGRRMLRVPFYAQEGKERLVEIESHPRGAFDCRGQDDAGGACSLPLGRSTRSTADARRIPESFGS